MKKPKLTEEPGELMEVMYEPFERLRNNMDEPVKKIMEIFLEDNEKRRERFCWKIHKIYKRMDENHQPLIKEINQDGKPSLEQLNQKIEEELTRTESVLLKTVDFSINENFIATKWKNQMIVRHVTRTEIILHTRDCLLYTSFM